MKKYLVAVAGVALIGMSLAACSTGPTETPSAALTNAAVAPVNNRSYTANDIANILKSVNTRLNLGGSVETQHGPQLQAIDALGAYLNGGNDLAVTPAHCVNMLQSDPDVASQLGNEFVVASILASSRLTIIANAVHGAPVAASRISSWAVSQRSLFSSCKHLNITETVNGQPTWITVDYKALTVNTTANQAVAFNESYVITGGGGATISSTSTIEAIDGNLVIVVNGVSVQDAPSLEKAVNAVVAAAK
ncbi:MAG TPA: hypothetical protein VIJ11_03465 [Galbitalea sp.]